MTSPVRVLLVEDSPDDAALLVRELCGGGYEPVWERVETEADLRAALARQEWDLITCDWVVAGFDAAEALRLIRQIVANVPIIVVSREVAEEVAVTAMTAGAADFVSKQRLTRLVPVVGRALRDAEARRARQRAEKGLIDRERKFRSVIENASDLISVMDANGIIRYASPSHERALGYAPEELIGKCAFDFVHPDDFGGVVQGYREGVVNREPARRAEFRFRHRDGSWRVFEGVAKNALDDPEVQGVIVTTRDQPPGRWASSPRSESICRLPARSDDMPREADHNDRSPLQVLLIEDSDDDAVLLTQTLRHGGFEPVCERVTTAEALTAALLRQEWDLIIRDWVVPGLAAPAALALIQELMTSRGGDVPVIVVSGAVDEESAVAAMKAGAHDFVSKQKLARLVPAVQRELRDATGRRAHTRWTSMDCPGRAFSRSHSA